MVLLAGSTFAENPPHDGMMSVQAAGPIPGATAWPTWPQPDWSVALQVFSANTDNPVRMVTYTLWVLAFTSMSPGPPPTATVGGGWPGQPARWVPLQVALLIIETVLSPKFAT